LICAFLLLRSDFKRGALIKAIAEFLRKVLSKNTSHHQVSPKIYPSIIGEQTSRRSDRIGPRLSLDLDCRGRYRCRDTEKIEIKDDGETDAEENVKLFGRKHYGEIANPLLGLYLSNTLLIHTQYGIRREGDNFKIGNSTLTINNE